MSMNTPEINRKNYNKKLDLLVVDDEREIINMLIEVLNLEGYKTRAVRSGEQAIKEVERKKPALIILDLMMPGINGLEVCKELKTQREYNAIPIIMLTAKKDPDTRTAGLMVGADDYLTKPFDIEDLLQAVSEQLKHANFLKNEPEKDFHTKFEIKSDYTFIKQINELIKRMFKQTHLSNAEISEFEYCLNEALTNAIEHGSKLDPSKLVYVTFTLQPDKLVIEIEDEGQGFDFHNVPDPTADENIFNPRGRGIFIMKNYMDDVEYNKKGTKITLTKYLSH